MHQAHEGAHPGPEEHDRAAERGHRIISNYISWVVTCAVAIAEYVHLWISISCHT